MGSKVAASVKTFFCLGRAPKSDRRPSESYDEAAASLLRPASSASRESPRYGTFTSKDNKAPLPKPTLVEVFTRQSIINLVAYTFLALHSVAYDQLLPVFLHNPRQKLDSPATHLPFKFAGGFGLGSSRIGTLFTAYGVVGCFIQFLVFPPIARRFGVLNCFKCCAVTFPIVCLITPYTALIQESATQQAAIFAVMIVKSFAVIFAFPCSIILLTNSAASLRILGTLNGFAVAVSAVGRAVGPALAGAAFTWGLEKGYVVTPYFLLALISAIGAIPIWYLVEMPGFSKTDDDESDTDDDEEEDDDEALLPTVDEDAIPHGAELVPEAEEDESENVSGPATARKRKSSQGESVLSRRDRSEGRLERRMSSPIGVRGGSVGPGGGRKLSNALAASNVGAGTGGTSFT